MENQHTKIKGYRDLSQAEIDLMNQVKIHAEQTELLLEKIRVHLLQQQREADEREKRGEFGCAVEINRLLSAKPARWLALGLTDLQTGFMAVTRAVAQPTTF